MSCYRTRKITVKLTEPEEAKYQRFLTHWETRTWSRLFRRALYDYDKAQGRPVATPKEIQADNDDLAAAKKLTDSMREKTPAKRGRPIGRNGTAAGLRPTKRKPDKSAIAEVGHGSKRRRKV